MTTGTTTAMTSRRPDQAVVAGYPDRAAAEAAVRLLAAGGPPAPAAAIIGGIGGDFKGPVGALRALGLIGAGVRRVQARVLLERLQAGEFLVVVHGGADEMARAQEILGGTVRTRLQTYGALTVDAGGHSLPRTRL